MSIKPKVLIYSNFLDYAEWFAINNYCINNSSDFQFLGAGESPVRFKKEKHSLKDIFYEKCFILDADFYEMLKNGAVEEPYPESLGNNTDWKVSMQHPRDEYVYELINKITILTQQIIKDIYGDSTAWEFGPFISKISEGQSLRLHCDGAQYSLPNYPMTDYSAVYYINNDYEGGENIMPAMGLKYKPEPNSLMIVSNASHEDSVHGIEKVTKGSRYMSQNFYTIVI